MPELSEHQRGLLEEEISRLRALRQQDEAQLRQQQNEFELFVRKLQELRSEIDERVSSLAKICGDLRSSFRRSPSELSSSYLVYVQSHLRLAGALQQALKRTESSDRVLQRRTREAVETQSRDSIDEEKRTTRSLEHRIRQILTPSATDVETLFGLEDDIDG